MCHLVRVRLLSAAQGCNQASTLRLCARLSLLGTLLLSYQIPTAYCILLITVCTYSCRVESVS
ncbi:hypothetical protein BCV70DRAFT_87252 [Testicularia cyperi]|uniref:Uncharacterized protein n=1 Tax=Testicularia cyperi TaxID=1882483 RepID=A0A317XRV7_9BASI|nr:hypothetical protein BCV70DRAFT_87252 [Testicularia cyperi]